MADVQTGTYPIADEVLQLSRALVNDMLRTTGGRILTNTANFTLPYLNSAIRRVVRYMADNGAPVLIKDNVILTNLTPTPSSDPATQVSVTANGYFDGVNQNAQPVLPADLILPLRLWERATGSQANFAEMTQPNDGITSQVPGSWFQNWEWRQDGIYLPGSTQAEDLRVRYAAMLASIGTNADLTKTSIPIRDGQEALAYAVIMQYGFARGSALRTEAETMMKEQCDLLISRQTRKDQRRVFRPSGFGSSGQSIDSALLGSTK